MSESQAEAWAPRGDSAHEDHFGRDHLPPEDEWARIDYSTLPELAAYPAQMNCASWLLDRQVEAHADRPVLRTPVATWTYSELLAKANQIAHVLVDDFGIRPGHRVLMRSPNNPMYVACWFAVMKIGAIAVATMPLLRARELTYIADVADVDVGICDKRLEEEMLQTIDEAKSLAQVVYFHSDAADGLEARMREKPESFDNVLTATDDVCLIAFTSGTTGSPKGCMHFHRDILAICDTFSRYVLKPDADDVFAGTPPIAFTFGLGALVTFPMYVGASTLLIESYTPESLVDALHEYRVTVLFTAPTMFRAITPAIETSPSPYLRKCVSAGETLPKPTFDDWHRATGLKIIDGIGATEMLHIFIATAGDEIRPGATGKPIPGYEAKVVDDDGRDVADGIVGRLAVRGPTACRYMNDPERQRAYVQDGWNFTGDAYMRDADGYFWYQSRTDDMIISAGYNISGPEVEAVLLEHDKVAECAVVGLADSERGQLVTAFVVLRDRAAGDDDMVRELQDHVKQTIAPYKYPRAVHFIDALPKTHTGKIQRFALRQAAAPE